MFTKKVFAALLMILVFAGVTFAADIAIMSIGQSPDAMMVRMVLKKMKINSDYESMMTPGYLKDQKVLIAVVGGSSKGLGSAGIDKEDEMVRAKAVIKEAKEKGLKVLVMHVGGEGRRGDLSDFFIIDSVPFGDKIIVVEGGNADKIFEKYKAASATIVTAPKIQNTGEHITAALKEWGVN